MKGALPPWQRRRTLPCSSYSTEHQSRAQNAQQQVDNALVGFVQSQAQILFLRRSYLNGGPTRPHGHFGKHCQIFG
jgi:hypothetical protein